MSAQTDLVNATDTLAALDLDGLSGSEALALAPTLSAVIARLTGTRLAALSKVADTGAWGLDGSRSMPHALARSEDEVHHVIPWFRGGVTSVADSVLLCWHDHDWVHANEVTIHRQDDRWLFADRDGLPIR